MEKDGPLSHFHKERTGFVTEKFLAIFVRVSQLGHSYSVENLMDSENHLLAYVRSGDEAAFAKVVTAYSSLVYGTAYRKTRNVQLAEEVTQNVFVLLARKAEKLVSRPGLGGWLHRTALLVSQNLLRSEAAHQRRTELVKEKSEFSPGQDIEIFFEGVDEALDRLSESDRTVVMMRFFEEKEFREIGAQVGKSADAVQKQIRRALDKLNRSLTAKGATFSLATIGLVLSSELAKAAPVASSALITTKAVTATSSVPVTSHLLANLLHTMNTLKTSTVVGAVLLVAAIPAVFQQSQARGFRKELTELGHRKQSLAMTRSSTARGSSAEGIQTPVRRLLSSSRKSLTGQEFLVEIEEALMSQNMNQMLQIFIPISLMTEEEIQILMAEVEVAEGQAQLKTMAIQMLLPMIPQSQMDRGAQLAKGIQNGVFSLNLTPEMSEWAREDLEGALAWFQASQEDGTLFGKGIESAEPDLGAVLAEELAKSDPERAFALADSVEPSGRATVLAGIARALAKQGDTGLASLVEPIKSLENIDAVNKVVKEVVGVMVKTGQRDEVLPFLNRIDAEPRVLKRALAVVVAERDAQESIAQRINWLKEAVSEEDFHSTVRGAVGELYLNETGGVREWIDSLPSGALRDTALASESSAMMFGAERKEAWERVNQIEDDAVREKQLEVLRERAKLLNLSGEHPAALHKQGNNSQ